MRSFRIAALFGVLCGAVSLTYAQQAIDLGSISGRVTDPSGVVVRGAQVIARHVDTNLTSTVATDDEGRFRFPYLRLGTYELIVRQEGFEEVTRRLTVTVGSAFELPITLAVGTVTSTVTVTGDATVLEAARSQVAATVSEAEIRALPLSGRQFLDVALVAPGVAPANIPSTQLFPETSAVPGVSLSVNSQRNISNNFVVDGVSANDDAAGLSGMTYGIDAIEQFQVVTSGAQAELGRALGGYVNVVTRSGTNVLHGTVYNFLRDDRLNAANPLLRRTLPMDQAQYGASLGGPLVPNRTFYFANVEQRRLDQTGLTTISEAAASAINARLRASGYAGPGVQTGLYRNPVDSTNLLAKLDHQIHGRDQVTVRYTLYDASAENARGAGALSAPSASSGLKNRDQSVAVSNTFTISPRSVLETRAQVAHGDLRAPATDPIGPSVTIAGVASFGTSSTSPTARENTQYQLVNNLSHQAGAHAWRLGVDLLYNADRITYPRASRGAYTFSSLANFLAGTYNTAGFTQTFGASTVAQTNPNIGLYAQDEWKVGEALTLNLGVRYDLQFLETIDTDTNNIAPRLGVAWTPFPSRNTVVRGSAGLFYDRVPLRPLANALLSAGNTTDLANLRQISVSLSPTQDGAPTFPEILPAAVPSVTLVNLTTMDRALENAYSRQASVEVEQQLGDRTTLAVGYQSVHGSNLLMSINQNVPTCAPSGSNNGCRPDPEYANNNQYSSVGKSNYHGMHVSMSGRPARWGHYRVSYTLSKSMNNLGEFFFSSPIDPGDLSKDWGRSDDDQRHRFVVSGAVQSPTGPARNAWAYLTHGFQVSAMLQAYSALPLNVTSGVTTIQGTPGRPLVEGPTPTLLDVRTARFIPRNAASGSDFFSVNLRVSREFPLAGRAKVEALVEGFNVTNRRNVVLRNSSFGAGAYPFSPSATFGQITAVGEPRAVQFGARVRF